MPLLLRPLLFLCFPLTLPLFEGEGTDLHLVVVSQPWLEGEAEVWHWRGLDWGRPLHLRKTEESRLVLTSMCGCVQEEEPGVSSPPRPWAPCGLCASGQKLEILAPSQAAPSSLEVPGDMIISFPFSVNESLWRRATTNIVGYKMSNQQTETSYCL